MNSRELPPVVTCAQMRAVDELAIKKYGVPSLVLMENAGTGIARHIIGGIFEGDATGRRVAVLCGPGNNGGDGYVIARLLTDASVRVDVYSTVPVTSLKGDAKTNAERASTRGISTVVVEGQTAFLDLTACDLIVDALFGTGFHGGIEGAASRLIQAANASGVPVVSVDTPSGLDNDTGQVAPSAVRATTTLTLGATKLGQWLWPGRSLVGHLDVIDIGIPADVLREIDPQLFLTTREYLRGSLPIRPPDGHKGTFGKALIVGGSAGLSGAVVLASNACMRSGVGLTYAAVPRSLVDVVDAVAIETVTRPLPEVGGKRAISRRALGDCLRMSADVDAVAIGPGLSTHHETQELVRRLVQRLDKPTVIDADGLNACAKDPTCLAKERHAPLVLTPHVGEMARLLGLSIEEVSSDRRSAAVAAARRFNGIVIMKGAPTFIAEPTGTVYLNPTGNSGMGSGGVGDVLTGVIVSLLAQGCQALAAAIIGTYIHGLAGDMAADSLGQRSLVASDIVDALPDALLYISQ